MGSTSSYIRTRWAAVGAAVAITLGAVGIGGLNIANADVSSGDRPVFVSINPCRLLDTRPGDNNVGPKTSPLGPQETFTATAHGSNGECTGPSTIPTDAVGLSLNVTAVGPTENTFLTFWGTGDNPGTSNLNPRAGGAPTPNSVSTPLSATGSFNIFNNAGNVNVIVDVNGYYANHNHDDRYYTETEADARFAPADAVTGADVTPVNIFSYSFDSGSEWAFGGALSHDISIEEECATAALDLPAGRTIESLSISYISQSGATLEVTLFKTMDVVGPVSSEADLITVPIASTDLTLISTPSFAISSVSVDATPDVIDPTASYGLSLCSTGDFNITNTKLATPLR